MTSCLSRAPATRNLAIFYALGLFLLPRCPHGNHDSRRSLKYQWLCTPCSWEFLLESFFKTVGLFVKCARSHQQVKTGAFMPHSQQKYFYIGKGNISRWNLRCTILGLGSYLTPALAVTHFNKTLSQQIKKKKKKKLEKHVWFQNVATIAQRLFRSDYYVTWRTSQFWKVGQRFGPNRRANFVFFTIPLPDNNALRDRCRI